MLVVCVYIHVRPEQREAFVRASAENARNTIEEPGNLRFDVLQQADDPNRFVLYEVYCDESGAKAHKATPHYARWAEAVAPWMAELRQSVTYESLFPEKSEQWRARKQMMNDE
jgi:(4S)-4-hydroxy-5-phosphonooxypentane-2,3-dione isomerase